MEAVPDASQLRLGAELRGIREFAELSGSEVARAIGWSQSKVSRVETGRFGASLAEVATLLDYYQVPEEVRAELLAQTARREGLEGAWVVRAGGPRRRQAEVGAIEGRVARLRQYQPLVIPGLLQTHAYAGAIAAAMGFDNASAIAERREQRHEVLRTRGDVAYEVVLDARALLRWPDAPELMAEQVQQLIDTDLPGLNLRILPVGTSNVAAVAGFLIYDFTETSPTVVLVEAHTADLYLSDSHDVDAYGALFDRLQGEALTTSQTREHLKRTLRDLRGGEKKEK